MPFVKPYRMGDVVRIKGDGDEEHVIDTVSLSGGDYEYSTNRSAWHDHDALEFVRECDEASIAVLIASQEAEERGDNEEEEEDEG